MRLCISGKIASSGSLPEQLARMCRERLVCEVCKEPHYVSTGPDYLMRELSLHTILQEKMNAERAAEGEALSSVDSKVYVEDTRFKVVSSKYELDTDTSFFDMARHST